MTTKTNSNEAPNPETQKRLIKEQRGMWLQALYMAEVNHRVAKRLKDEQRTERWFEEAKTAQQWLDELDGELRALESKNGNAT